MTNKLLNTSLAEIVRSDFRTSKVFDQFGLDFCCKGKQSLLIACEQKSLDPHVVLAELNKTLASPNAIDQFDGLTNADLIDHIVNVHHKYVREHSPLILKYLVKVSSKHGERYPYMQETLALFSTLKAELEDHLEKEEQIVFPLIKEIGEGNTANDDQLSFLVANMEAEHSSAGELLEKIRETCHNFEVPEQACNTFIVVLHLLEEFEADLHTHVFLENHILFSRLIDSKVAL